MQVSDVLHALKTVMDPDLKKDLVTLGMIQDVQVGLELIEFRVVLTTPACPVKAQLEQACKEAVQAIAGGRTVVVKMDAQVNRPSSGGHAGYIQGVAQIIAVSSGKGGVGKSTVAVNLAVSLAKLGARVGLMDADIYGPNVPTMLGAFEKPRLETDDKKNERFIPTFANGVKVMSIGFLIPPDQPVVWRGPMLHNIVQQFCHQVAWGDLDYLIVDMPPGTGDVQLSLAQLVPLSSAILVSTANEVSAQDVRRAFFMFEKVRVPVLGIVENMSTFVCDGCEKVHNLFSQGGGKILANRLNTELLAQLPFTPFVSASSDSAKPFVLAYEKHPAAVHFVNLATRVAQKMSLLVQSKGLAASMPEIGNFAQ